MITEPRGGVAVGEAEVSFFAVQVDGTDLGQVLAAGIQVVVVLQGTRTELNPHRTHQSQPVLRPP